MTNANQILVHPSLLGCVSLIDRSAPARLVAACADTRKLVAMTITSQVISYAGESVEMDTEPGAMISFNGATWVVCKDGTLRSFTIVATPVQSASYDLECQTNAWLASYSSVMYVPGPRGTLLVVNSSGTILARAEGILADIAMIAATTDGYVYAFDGAGNGIVIQVDGTTGAITLGNTFLATDAKGIVNAIVDADNLVIATLERRITMSIATRATPVITGMRSYREEIPTSVVRLSAGHYYVAMKNVLSTFPHPWLQGPTVTHDGVIVGLPHIGGICIVNPALDENGVSINVP